MKKIFYSFVLTTITFSSQLNAMWFYGISRYLAQNAAQRGLATRPTNPALSRKITPSGTLLQPQRILPASKTITPFKISASTRPVKSEKSLIQNPCFRTHGKDGKNWHQSKTYSTIASKIDRSDQKTNWSKWILAAGAVAATLYYNICYSDETKNEISNKLHQGLGDRSAEVQAECDSSFEYCKSADRWGVYNGRSKCYTLVNLDEDVLFEQFVHKKTHADIYIIDAGCAQGKWGRNTLNILKDSKYQKSGKHFHIFSITGGQECDELVEHHDHVTLYQFNQFKIENIDEEFAKRGFDLTNKVSIIVSHWTLRHLVDPFGTVKRMYSLLTPQQGMLLSNAFLFKFHCLDEIQAFPQGNETILIDSNATCLFKEWDCGRDAGQFLLMRTNNNELEIPLEYTGTTHSIGEGYQCESQTVTVFNPRNLRQSKINRVYMNDKKRIYCQEDDMKCKKLYQTLLEQNLFWPESAKSKDI